jgi:hypothetical protein
MDANDPSLEDKILLYPLMQPEITRQRKDIELLQGLDEDLSISFSIIREKWFDTKESCLGLVI